MVLAHGATKEDTMPNKDIDLAISRRKKFILAPTEHSHMEELI